MQFWKKKFKVHISHEFRSLIRTSLMIFFFSFHFIRVVKHAQILSIFLFDVYLFESNRVKTNARHAYVWDRGNGWRVCLPHQYLENNDFAAATIELFYLFFFSLILFWYVLMYYTVIFIFLITCAVCIISTVATLDSCLYLPEDDDDEKKTHKIMIP